MDYGHNLTFTRKEICAIGGTAASLLVGLQEMSS